MATIQTTFSAMTRLVVCNQNMF